VQAAEEAPELLGQRHERAHHVETSVAATFTA